MALLVLGELTYIQQWRAAGYGQPPVLRVAAPAHEWAQSGLSPFGPGFEQELLDKFCAESGMRWVRVKTDSWQDAWDMVADNRADIVLSLGTTPPDALSKKLEQGPTYANFRPVIVHSDQRYGLREECDMCDRPILVSSNPALPDSIRERAKAIDCKPELVISTDPDVTPILERLHKNQARFGLMDQGRFKLLQPFFDKVREARQLPGDIAYRWYWSTRSPALSQALENYWKSMNDSDAMDNLYDKYFGFLPEETDYYEIRHLVKTMEKKLPIYGDAIVKAAHRNNIDPLLLTAVIYQESRFDAAATSHTGVRGLMQLTQITAAEMGVNRNDPFDSIRGGSRYLRKLHDGLEGLELNETQRWLFTLAAYNRGAGHLRDAIELARNLGHEGNSWRELKEAFPKLAYERWYKNARHGYTRGYEAVDYVDRIRYYYYILHGLVVLSRPEAQQLAALGTAPIL